MIQDVDAKLCKSIQIMTSFMSYYAASPKFYEPKKKKTGNGKDIELGRGRLRQRVLLFIVVSHVLLSFIGFVFVESEDRFYL